MTWQPTGLPHDAGGAAPPFPIEIAARALILTVVEGRWYAFEDRCSHAGCAFSDDGEVDGVHVICDCHGSEFDVRTGAVVRPPAREPIATFPVRVLDGMVEVDV